MKSFRRDAQILGLYTLNTIFSSPLSFFLSFFLSLKKGRETHKIVISGFVYVPKRVLFRFEDLGE